MGQDWGGGLQLLTPYATAGIQERQPFYNHLEWEQQRLQNEKYLRNISQFPESLPSMTKSFQGGATGDMYGTAPGPHLAHVWARTGRDRDEAPV
jgi:hypothetical protein